MSAIHCKIEKNALTVPRSCKLRFIPNNNLGTEDIAEEMCNIAPFLTPDVAEVAISALDMRERGASGEEAVVKENGTYSLPGFAGSAVSSLDIRVDHYLALWSMLRNDYNGRLVDVLEVTVV